MKVCIIVGSPRRQGTTSSLCAQFAKGAMEAGHEVEIVYLGSKKIAPCLSCMYCRQHGNVCVLKDEANEVIQKMIDADVWVLASPCYFYSLSAQMKALIDRFFAREYEIREATQRKQVYYIVTSMAKGLENMPGLLESLRGFVRVLRTVDEAGVIDGTGVRSVEEIVCHSAYQIAYQMGKSI